MRKTVIPVLALAVLVAAMMTARPSADGGAATPDVTFATADGQSVHLADLKGQVVLLDFWASWCVPCRKSFPAVDALYKELHDRGLAVFAVNVDEQHRDATTFLDKRPHAMPVVYDPQGRVAGAFKVIAMPSTMIIDRAGHVRHMHVGYTEKTIAQYRDEVLQLVAETP